MGMYNLERDIDPYVELYTRHIQAMTVEKLHDKGDIASELAWRDYEIDALKAKLEIAVEGLREIASYYGITVGQTISGKLIIGLAAKALAKIEEAT